jgi:hypothetical protein
MPNFENINIIDGLVYSCTNAGKRRMSGGRHSTCGTPQGGVVSPMLANVYLNCALNV